MAFLNRANPMVAQTTRGVIMGSGDIVTGPNRGQGTRSAAYSRIVKPIFVTGPLATKQSLREAKRYKQTQKEYSDVKDKIVHADGSSVMRHVKQGRSLTTEMSWSRSFTNQVLSMHESRVDQKMLRLATAICNRSDRYLIRHPLPAPMTFAHSIQKHSCTWFLAAAASVDWPELTHTTATPDIHDLFDHMVDCWPVYKRVWRNGGMPQRRIDQFERELVKFSKESANSLGMAWQSSTVEEFAMMPAASIYLASFLYPLSTDGKLVNIVDGGYFSQIHGWKLPVISPTPVYQELLFDLGRRHRQWVSVESLLHSYPLKESTPGWLGVREVAERVRKQEYADVSKSIQGQCTSNMGGDVSGSQIVSMSDDWMRRTHGSQP
jgi:hypothetical protein